MVYSGVSVFDGSPVALKFFKRGSEYDSALRRERYVLERLSAPHHNLVECAAQITYRGAHCLVMELLDLNIRQVQKDIIAGFKRDYQHIMYVCTPCILIP